MEEGSGQHGSTLETMRIAILLFLTFIFTNAWSMTKACSSIKRINVQINSSDVMENWATGSVSAFSTQIFNEWLNDNGLESSVYTVSSAHQVRNIFLSLQESCVEIANLAIVTHGDMGYLGLPEGPIDSSNIRDVFSGFQDLFSKGAKIQIFGCNVARSCQGKAFLATMGLMLLPKGGEIKAADQFELSWFRIAPFVPLNFGYQKLEISETQQAVDLNQSCNQEMSEKLLLIKKILRRNPELKQPALIALQNIAAYQSKIQSLPNQTETLEELKEFLDISNSAESDYQVFLEKAGERDSLIQVGNRLRLFN